MRILSVTICILLCSTALLAQSERPRLFDTIPDVPCEDAIARLDHFFTEITDKGPDVIGVAIYYEGNYIKSRYTPGGEKISERSVAPVDGEVQERVRWLQNYVNFRNFPKDKIRFVSGGYRESFAIDLWTMPVRAAMPRPTPTLGKMKYRKGEFTHFSCL